ncbi:MAG: ParA family protein [Clostridia bacterium]|nr:ParA family protein [Clostridia bacterium]
MLKTLKNLQNLTVITGHFGSGKTNFAVNLAKAARQDGRDVTLIDMDIVNPYFRAADNRAELEALGVRCILPDFANTSVDIPSLPPEIFSAFEAYETETDRLTIFDVGGDNGAVALGMYNRFFAQYPYDLLYVINRYRPLTEEPADCAALLGEIEYYSRLKTTGIVNCSNLGAETTAEDVSSTIGWAKDVAERCSLPLLCTAALRELAGELETVPDLFPIENATKFPF